MSLISVLSDIVKIYFREDFSLNQWMVCYDGTFVLITWVMKLLCSIKMFDWTERIIWVNRLIRVTQLCLIGDKLHHTF